MTCYPPFDGLAQASAACAASNGSLLLIAGYAAGMTAVIISIAYKFAGKKRIAKRSPEFAENDG